MNATRFKNGSEEDQKSHVPFRKRLRRSYVTTLLSGSGSAAVNMQLWRPAVVIAGTTTFISHEFGHVIVAKAYGADTAPPLFIPLGVVTIGSTRMRKMPKNGRHRAGIYLAGPIAGLATASMVLISFIGTPWLVIGILFVGSEAYSYFLGSDAVRAKKARKKHE